ncbi:MAG: hypothetical protein Q9181_001060 [Wetmoreana brouardii]
MMASGLLLNKHAPWPQVIDTRHKIGKAGEQECLRFPPFHQEMLTQSWWSAGEEFGRVKVIISEGLAGGQQPSGFRRVKNIVAFSFQHAPLAVLEDAGIAWPNAGMWSQVPLYQPSSPRRIGAMDPDAHAHSPRRRNTSTGSTRNTAAVIAPRLLSQAMLPPARRTMTDPFLEHRVPTWGTRASTSDASMPDYSHSATPRSSRHPSSLHDMESTRIEPHLQQSSQFEEYIAAYSPINTSGTQGPSTTRVSRASNSPPRNMNVLMRSIREPSDISMKSRFSEAQASDGERHAHTKTVPKPAGEVRGRKEGRNYESDLLAPTGLARKPTTGSAGRRKQSAKEENVLSKGDSKRKRASVISISNIISGKSEELGSSPTRKVSKVDMVGGGPSSGAEGIARVPLGSLENIQ